MREWLATCLLALGTCLLAVPALDAAAVVPGGANLQIEMLDLTASDVSIDTVSIETLVGGALDTRFKPFNFVQARERDTAFWLRLRAEESSAPGSVPALASSLPARATTRSLPRGCGATRT